MGFCSECIKSTVCKYNDGINEWCKGSCPEFINYNQVLDSSRVYNIPQKATWIHSADGIYCSHCWNKLHTTGTPQMCPYCYSQMTDNGWEMR